MSLDFTFQIHHAFCETSCDASQIDDIISWIRSS